MDEAETPQYIYREYAKSQKGQRIYGEISDKRYIRTSIISSLNSQKKLIAPLLFDGMTDTNLVLWWVESMLLPELPQNSTIIWDK